MTFFRFIVFFTLALLMTRVAVAQTDTTTAENEVRLGIDKGPIATGQPFKAAEYPKNLVRVGVLIPLGGQYQVFYERALTQRLSVEGGLGITSQPIFLRPRAVLGSFEETIDEQPDTEYSVGPTVKLGVKFYPGYAHQAPRGFYMGYEIAYRAYNYTSLSFDSGYQYDPITGQNIPVVRQRYDTYSRFTDFGRITLGLNGIAASGFNSDFYLGGGIGRRELYHITEAYYAGGYGTQPNYEDYITPIFIIGAKIGVGF